MTQTGKLGGYASGRQVLRWEKYRVLWEHGQGDLTQVGGGAVREGFLGAVQSKLDLRRSGTEPEGPSVMHSFFKVWVGGSIEQSPE